MGDAETNSGRRGSVKSIASSTTASAARTEPRDAARERARTAWQWVDEAVKRPYSDMYGTLARKLSSYLQVSGLGQTMAFLYSKARGEDGGAHGLLFEQLARHLARGRTTERRDMAVILNLGPAEYRRATAETMAIALWLKRFAEGRLGEKES